MISTQSIVSKMVAALDAEGSDRYRFDQDFVPAINNAIDWMVAVFNKAFSENKLNEEVLSELSVVKVWQANQYSRVKIDPAQLGHQVWTVLGVFPEPQITPQVSPPSQSLPETSIMRPDISYLDSDFSADRLSIEQWNNSRKNVFMPGNTTMNNQLKKYAYLNPFNYSSSTYAAVKEIQVRPSIAGKFVAIAYIKVPNRVNVSTDQIEFPENVSIMLFQKALNFISYKQGDRTSLFAVTTNDVRQLAQLMQ